jgi:hypothetical protein
MARPMHIEAIREAETMDICYSSHAQTRIRQRGIRESDIPMIVAAGTPIDQDSVLLLAQDADREIRRLKQEIAAFERPKGWRVVIVGDTVVTVYRPSRKTEKRLLRGQRRRPAGHDPMDNSILSTNSGDYSHAA